MTVKQLIEDLKSYPENMKVIGLTNALITSVSKSEETFTDYDDDEKEKTEIVVTVF